MGKSWRRFSCGVGSLLNECWRQMALSFGLVFYTRVVRLSSGQAGIILAVGQVTALISTVIFGYLCDKVDVPILSKRMGRKKTWHLFSTILLAPFLLMAFSRCFPCTDSSSTWPVAFAYFICGYGGAAFMYGATEMAHLSLISVISESQDEAIILNSLRTGFSFIAGIVTYAVAWAILGQSSQKELSADNWKEFSITAATLTATGLFFAALFHIGTKENKKTRTKRVSTALVSVNHTFVMMVLGLSTDEPQRKESRKTSRPKRISAQTAKKSTSSIFSPWSTEDSEEDQGEGASRKTSSGSTKSRLRKISDYFMPFYPDLIVESQASVASYESDDESDKESQRPSKKFSRQRKITVRSSATNPIPEEDEPEGRTEGRTEGEAVTAGEITMDVAENSGDATKVINGTAIITSKQQALLLLSGRERLERSFSDELFSSLLRPGRKSRA